MPILKAVCIFPLHSLSNAQKHAIRLIRLLKLKVAARKFKVLLHFVLSDCLAVVHVQQMKLLLPNMIMILQSLIPRNAVPRI